MSLVSTCFSLKLTIKPCSGWEGKYRCNYRLSLCETSLPKHTHNGLHTHHNSRYESHHQLAPPRTELWKAVLIGKNGDIKYFKLQPTYIYGKTLYFPYINIFPYCWEQSTRNIFTLKQLAFVLLILQDLFNCSVCCISVIIMSLFMRRTQQPGELCGLTATGSEGTSLALGSDNFCHRQAHHILCFVSLTPP